MAEPAPAAITESGFLGGRVILRQPAEGHRSGSDAVLLAAAAPAAVTGLVLDVGAGVGAAGLALAAVRPGVTLGLVEKDLHLAALAQENLGLNGFAHGSVHAADVLDPASRSAAGLSDAVASLVITNPPFLDERKVRASPHAGKRAAHVMPAGASLAAWVSACLALLEDGGTFVIIHRPEALPEMLAALAGRAGEICLMPVQPQSEKPAVRLLLRAKKARRAPLRIAPSFILHEGNRFSVAAEAVHRGEAMIVW